MSYADRLAELDSCLLSDALDSLGLPGAVAGITPVWQGARLAGRAVTMRTVPFDGRLSTRHLGAAALERAVEGEIVVVQQVRPDGGPTAASWGGLLARAAVYRGLGGVVVDGACRDVDEIRELGLPVSASHVVPFTARGRFVEDAVGEPVTIGGVAVEEGDFVLADGSGVVFVPAGRIDEVLAVADRLASREAHMAVALEKGDQPSEVLGRAYEEMLHDR
ncbi:RraA family protein [Pseudonocardia dioxanivorans]|uniref:RraA family protein n=1 Tax=Pseudonocardia dioxanivorans TaxID=240495 RepID=UPI000CD13618|nr:dimethylmenaquinone methyltransferase [Pseudonocardia dioxanivorans]